MGIRFACHVCGKHLNIKRELGGRRGICPSCSARFRIPREDAETSSPVEVVTSRANQSRTQGVVRQSDAGHSAATVATANESMGDAMVSASGDVAAHLAGDGRLQGGTTLTETDEGTSVAEVDPDLAAAADAWIDQGLEAGLEDVGRGDDGGDKTGAGPAPSAEITLPDDEPEAAWYVRPPSGGQYGPATGEILKQWIEEGRVASTALLWRDGWPQWRDASEALPEMADRLPNGSVSGTLPSIGNQSPAVTEAGLSQATRLSGESKVGTTRRARSMKRVAMIGVLTALAAVLIGVLLVVVNRTG